MMEVQGTTAVQYPSLETEPQPQSFNQSAKLKIAPRSSLQFKVGPHFTKTVSLKTVVDSNGHIMNPSLKPRIDRGFELVDNEWVGYKRNYFTLVSSFGFEGVPFTTFTSSRCSLLDDITSRAKKIKYFALRLVARCVEDRSTVKLVQHTAKRDRGPQFSPQDQIVVPGELPSHTTIREAANVRNNGKIAKLDKIFFFERSKHDARSFNISGLKHYPGEKISKVARFERVQFSSSINFKKTSPPTKRFILVIELIAFTDDSVGVPVAYTETPPLIIRGRSPSNYRGTPELIKPNHEVATEEPSRGYNDGDAEFDGSFGDLQTYEILKNATSAMDLYLTQHQTPLTKKRKRACSNKIKSVNDQNRLEHSVPLTPITPIGALSKAQKNKRLVLQKLKKKQKSNVIISKDTVFPDAIFSFDSKQPELSFPVPWSNENMMYHPLTPMSSTQPRSKIYPNIDVGVSGLAQSVLADESMKIQAEIKGNLESDNEKDQEYSFDTSFGLAKLFEGIEAPIPTFRNLECTNDTRSYNQKSCAMSFEEELLQLKRNQIVMEKLNKVNGLIDQLPVLLKNELSLVNFSEFDEFPSFSLGFNF